MYTSNNPPVLLQQLDRNNQKIKNYVDKRFNSIESKLPKVYGCHIDGSESDPSEKVTYLADAVGMTPAYMDYDNDRFNYGSWNDDIWFIKECKPCILSQSGYVIKYLNKDDYTKDVDGNTVAIDSGLVGANVMIEFPKIWYKSIPTYNDSYSGDFYISPIKLDEDYKDYAYIDYLGNHKEHFYMPAYNGSLVNGVMRSISGAAISKNLNATQEITYCKANGNGWNTEDAGEIMLINFLLILMGKSTDTQAVFGNGVEAGSETEFNKHVTGEGNTKGMFYGSNGSTTVLKVFGIENWWGLQWRRYAGLINDCGVVKSKMCYGNEDGSTSFDFNTTGDGYVDIGIAPSGTSGGYINKMKFTKDGMFYSVSSGSQTTDYCDGGWFNNAQLNYALRGGTSADSRRCGAFTVTLSSAPSDCWWYDGAAPSYK